jgi:tetratricopeptide (TPR) repeat protein
MFEVSMRDAIRHSSAFPRWPTRRDPGNNRLEPECWPFIAPGFKFNKESRVFTIGSCFARNIEQNLSDLGLDVPVHRFFSQANGGGAPDGQGGDLLNRYTPPSIFQELLWARKILDRDDVVRVEDVEPFLLELQNGNFIDLHRRSPYRSGLTLDRALEERQLLYKMFREAFLCDIVVMTLGLVECWWDRISEQYVEFYPDFLRYKDRFVFRRLDYPEAYQFTRDSLELLGSDTARRVLLTTSPVPIARTFMPDDVIVANAYSKAVLRAVAGKIAMDLPNVDYFPSFESVMLTKRREVWEDDLVHVERAFVGRIIARVVESYVEEAPKAPLRAFMDEQLRFIGLVQAKEYEEAAALYERLGRLDEGVMLPEFWARAAQMLLQMNRPAEARAAFDRAVDQLNGAEHIRVLWECVAGYEALGNLERAEEVRRLGYQICKARPILIVHLTNHLRTIGNSSDATWLMERAEREPNQPIFILTTIARHYLADERASDAERLLRRCMAMDPVNEEILLLLAEVLSRRAEWRSASEVFEAYLTQNPYDLTARRQLANAYIQNGRLREAEEQLRTIVNTGEANAHIYDMLARCELRSGRASEALVHAQIAVEMDPDNVPYQNFLKHAAAQVPGRQRMG